MHFDNINCDNKYLSDIIYIIREGISNKKQCLSKINKEGINTQLLVETFNIIGTKHSISKPWIGVQKEHERLKGKGKEDIYFHLNDDSYTRIFYMEAKRLPKYRTKNKQEYVISDKVDNKISGGIQRYKLSIHGDHMLKYNGMIAYVENKSINDWLTLINETLHENYPDDNQLISNNYQDEYISTHMFENKNYGSFTMHHFWINLI